MKRKETRLKKMGIFLLVLCLACSMWGCAGLPGSGKDSLDIDYVGADGEITEEEVTASTGGLDWLKKKLSGDKKENGREDTVQSAASNEEEEKSVRGIYENTADEEVSARTEDGETGNDVNTGENKKNNPKKDTDDSGQPVIPGQDEEQDTNDKKPTPGGKKNTVTFTIRCDTAVANGMHKEAEWAGIVPADGCILPVITMEFEEGETVFDLLCRVRDTYKLQMEYSGANGGQYIEGINNLYEFDGGRWSGWMYCVNDWYPNYGCGQYTVAAGDVIEWNYTCDLGLDLDAEMPGAQEWKDTHD